MFHFTMIFLRSVLEYLNEKDQQIAEDYIVPFLSAVATIAFAWSLIIAGAPIFLSPAATKIVLPLFSYGVVAAIIFFAIRHINRATTFALICYLWTAPATKAVFRRVNFFIGAMLLLAFVFTLVPVQNDWQLILPFDLGVLALCFFIEEQHGRFRKAITTALVVMIVIWFLGGRDKISSYANANSVQAAIGALNGNSSQGFEKVLITTCSNAIGKKANTEVLELNGEITRDQTARCFGNPIKVPPGSWCVKAIPGDDGFPDPNWQIAFEFRDKDGRVTKITEPYGPHDEPRFNTVVAPETGSGDGTTILTQGRGRAQFYQGNCT